MEIKRMKLSDIKPALYNPRKDLKPGDPEYDKMKRSINEFDCVEPLVWNKRTKRLVGGHQRLKILKEKGVKEFEVSVVDLDGKREKALNVALNKIQGDWDFTKLADLMTKLDDGEFDLELTGFDMSEIEELMNWTPKEEEPFDAAAEADKIKKPKSKRGEIYRLGRHKFGCLDASKKEDIAKLMKGEKADIIFSDPPYGKSLDTDYSGISKNWKGQVHFAESRKYEAVKGDDKEFDPTFLLKLFDYCDEIFLWGADYYYCNLPQGSWFVWDKTAGHTQQVVGNEFEICWSKKKHRKELLLIKWAGAMGLQSQDIKKRLHPTQKPLELCNWFIEKFSKKDNITVDLFGGSGSTLIAAEQLNRQCRMMEIDETYCDVIIARWEKFAGEKAELIKE